MAALLLALLLAPDTTYDLKLRFGKGMVYEESSARRITLRAITAGRVLRWDKADECLVRRTVVEVGEDGVPSEEKVEVLKSVATVNEAPDDKTGATERPSQGRTFLWRRTKGGGFALFDGDKDVSLDHADVVQRLRSRSAVRLPPGPVAVGATWEVAALDLVQADGKEPPEGLEGKGVFTLAEVKDGVARITFEVNILYKNMGRAVTEAGTGTWLFDVKNGREIKLEGEGKLEIEKKDGGFGTQRTSREITYR